MGVCSIVFYSTSHGFGHASRDIEVLRAVHAKDPNVRLHLRTAVAGWFVADALQGTPCEVSHAVLDVGIRQASATEQDIPATLQACCELLARRPGLLAQEVAFLRALRPDRVICDVPGIAMAAAAACGIPAYGLTNFSWDWIYAGLGEPGFEPIIEAFARDYATASGLLRLPFHGGDAAFTAFREVEDLPMIARRSTLAVDEARAALGLDPYRAWFLLSFGGLGAGSFDLSALEGDGYDAYGFIITPPWRGLEGLTPTSRLRFVDNHDLASRGLGYQDLVRACDGVITKPGYGIVSECLANETRVLYTPRGRFAEYPCLVEGLHRYGVAELISNDDLYRGHWQPSLERLMARCPPRCVLPVDGARVAAERILA